MPHPEKRRRELLRRLLLIPVSVIGVTLLSALAAASMKDSGEGVGGHSGREHNGKGP